MTTAFTDVTKIKSYLKITSGTDDALITTLANAANDFLSTFMNRDIASQSYDEKRDGNGKSRMMFGNWPVTAVNSVLVNGVAIPPAPSVIDNGYRFSQFELILVGYCFTAGMLNVELSYTAGFGSIPNDLSQAATELAALRYKEKDRLGITNKTLANEIVAYSQKDMPDSVKTVLNQYKSVIPIL